MPNFFKGNPRPQPQTDPKVPELPQYLHAYLGKQPVKTNSNVDRNHKDKDELSVETNTNAYRNNKDKGKLSVKTNTKVYRINKDRDEPKVVYLFRIQREESGKTKSKLICQFPSEKNKDLEKVACIHYQDNVDGYQIKSIEMYNNEPNHDYILFNTLNGFANMAIKEKKSLVIHLKNVEEIKSIYQPWFTRFHGDDNTFLSLLNSNQKSEVTTKKSAGVSFFDPEELIDPMEKDLILKLPFNTLTNVELGSTATKMTASI